ncbi:MAG: thiamine diphosphokinase [Pseudomonadota bacterium]
MKTETLVRSDRPVLLIGPVSVEREVFLDRLTPETLVVAADGGADQALSMGVVPDFVIGDFDSYSGDARIPNDRRYPVAEQDSTDFEKCLARIEAPLVLAMGFLGRRIDHGLAVMSVLARFPAGTCILVSHDDVVVHCPNRIELDLAAETRVSLFPMAAVRGWSTGLNWPIEGIDFAPNGAIGTSNHATGPIQITMEGPGMLLILPPHALPKLEAALQN